MKKNKFTEFFKGKGYYVLLFVGVVAIAAVAIIGSQISSTQKDEEKEFVDLNDTDSNIAAGEKDKLAENNPVSEGIANNESGTSKDTVTNDKDVASNDAELEDYSEKSGDASEQAQAGDTKDVAKAEDTVETTGNTVQPDNTAAIEALSFKADDGLMWPIKGNVLMDYSMDHTIYFATLMQYKVNPAIIIDAEVGAEVKAATDGIVTSIDENNEETGFTITINIGDGYSLVYGQLDKDSVSLKVGDSVKEGTVVGKIDEPTNYYCVEGSNLYFEVMKDDQSVNPMLLLR